VLNPTIVLRAGLQPMERPNGSGGGFTAIEDDINASTKNVNFVRASVPLGTSTATSFNLSSVIVGEDWLAMLVNSSANGGTHVPGAGLSSSELLNIYTSSTTDNKLTGATGTSIPCPTWNQLPGNSGGSTDTILPDIPQPNSGTYKVFLDYLEGLTPGTTPTTLPGNCVAYSEENDPYAITDLGTASAPDVIEPMSLGRLNLYNGITGTGHNEGFGYFLDPTCPIENTTGDCGTAAAPNSLAPPVTLQQDEAGTVNAGDGNPVFDQQRPLYLYFRNSDLTSTTKFQSTSTLNWLETLFYNPCSPAELSAHQCSLDPQGFETGPGGVPWIDQSAGQTALSDAGVTPVDTLNGTSYQNDGP